MCEVSKTLKQRGYLFGGGGGGGIVISGVVFEIAIEKINHKKSYQKYNCYQLSNFGDATIHPELYMYIHANIFVYI